MILLIQAIGQAARELHAMRIMPELRRGVIGQEVGPNALVERPPVLAGVRALEHAAARHRDVEMRGVARIDQDRMQLGAVRRAVLIAAAPRFALRMRIEPADAFPRGAAVVGAEESLRRGSRIPGAGLAGMSRCQPERVIDDPPAVGGEGGRTRRLLPRAPVVRRAKHGRTEVSGARRHQHRLAVARVDDSMMNRVSEKLRAGKPPTVARDVASKRPQTLARGHQQARSPRRCGTGRG